MAVVQEREKVLHIGYCCKRREKTVGVPVVARPPVAAALVLECLSLAHRDLFVDCLSHAIDHSKMGCCASVVALVVDRETCVALVTGDDVDASRRAALANGTQEEEEHVVTFHTADAVAVA